MAQSYLTRFASPVVKLAQFFEKSRDRWKAKYLKLKRTCKLLGNQTRAVEKSRESWRERAAAAERRVGELEREVEQIKIGPRASPPATRPRVAAEFDRPTTLTRRRRSA
jgi:hypothetical protein